MRAPNDPVHPVGQLRRREWVAGGLVLVAVVAAYANSLQGPFIFDDISSIVDNPTIRSFSPWWQPLVPVGGGATVDGRPVVNLTLALNHHFGGLEVRGYHLVNLAIHLVATLLLFGVVRRTLAREGMPAELRAAAGTMAIAVAGLWALHPLQTETVTYVVQRTEALGSLWYLAAVYGFIRGADPRARAPRTWLAASVGACLLGTGTKEIIATAPLVVLLYDRTFVAGSFREAWRRRRWYHLAAFATWLPLGLLIVSTHGRGNSVGFATGVTPWASLLTQGEAVVLYLRLALWPHPLVLDYGRFAARPLATVWPHLLLLAGLGGATIWALAKRPRLGFVGAWFFLLLAPSSSFVPILTQGVAEHRMYLALASIVLLGVLGLWHWAGRWAWLAGVALGLACGGATMARNHDYRSARAIWADTAAKAPGNSRAFQGLAYYCRQEGDVAAAMRHYEESLRLDPGNFDSRLGLAEMYLETGDRVRATPHLRAAQESVPATSAAHNNLGRSLFAINDPAAAIPHFRAAIALDPTNAPALNNLGYALAAGGDFPSAIGCFREACRLQPDFGPPFESLGRALWATGDLPGASAALESAARLMPDKVDLQMMLGMTQARNRQFADAARTFQRVLSLDANNAAAARALAEVQSAQGR
jgi:tetratricopeptide (TPR) repeat protein